MKKLFKWMENNLPLVWALLWASIITLVSIGSFVWAISWVVTMIERVF